MNTSLMIIPPSTRGGWPFLLPSFHSTYLFPPFSRFFLLRVLSLLTSFPFYSVFPFYHFLHAQQMFYIFTSWTHFIFFHYTCFSFYHLTTFTYCFPFAPVPCQHLTLFFACSVLPCFRFYHVSPSSLVPVFPFTIVSLLTMLPALLCPFTIFALLPFYHHFNLFKPFYDFGVFTLLTRSVVVPLASFNPVYHFVVLHPVNSFSTLCMICSLCP